ERASVVIVFESIAAGELVEPHLDAVAEGIPPQLFRLAQPPLLIGHTQPPPGSGVRDTAELGKRELRTEAAAKDRIVGHRTEERRVGKEGRSRWTPCQYKIK